MSTHAIVAYREPDNDHWVGVYVHSDGSTVGARLQAAVAAVGPQAVRDLIDATPQGFAFFDPANSAPSLLEPGVSLHRAFNPDELSVRVRSRRGIPLADYPYLHILELDGTVRTIPDWS